MSRARFLKVGLDGNYEGPWPPFPGMYPVSFVAAEGSPLLSILIWDKDASQDAITKDLSRALSTRGTRGLSELLRPRESDLLVPLYWATPDEIADVAADAVADRKLLLVDLIGTSRSTERDFQKAWQKRDLPMITVPVGEKR